MPPHTWRMPPWPTTTFSTLSFRLKLLLGASRCVKLPYTFRKKERFRLEKRARKSEREIERKTEIDVEIGVEIEIEIEIEREI